MRPFLWLLGMSLGVSAFGTTAIAGPNPSEALAAARAEMVRIEGLVAAGVAPRIALDAAAATLEEAKDDATLAETLYANLEVSQLTPDIARSMVEAAQRRVDRRQAVLKEKQAHAEQGVVARTALTPFIEDLDQARRTLDDAQIRAQLFEELAAMVQRETEVETAEVAPGSKPAAERFDGKGIFNDAHWRKIVLAYEHEFHQGLTISARGETAYHRSLGFDHRGRIDIAIDPDSAEGKWLKQFLESLQVPYFAYRRAVAGQASAAHVHIGPPSPRRQS
jgi:hypothetical protein